MEAARRRLHNANSWCCCLGRCSGDNQILPLFLGGGVGAGAGCKGRRHSGVSGEQGLMILYGGFRMRVGNAHWLTSGDTEVCGGVGSIFHEVICVYLCTLLGKILTLLQEARCGTVLAFKISDVAWK